VCLAAAVSAAAPDALAAAKRPMKRMETRKTSRLPHRQAGAALPPRREPAVTVVIHPWTGQTRYETGGDAGPADAAPPPAGR
jgi:hypothetical protein